MSKDNQREELVDSSMSLGDHLEELRMRLLRALLGLAVGVVAGFAGGKYIIAFLEMPYIRVMGADSQMQALAPAEGFVAYVKIAVISGLLISSPWVFYHIWCFVAAGLYPHEKKYVHLAVPFSAILFVGGAFFFLLVVGPLTLKFLVIFNKDFLGAESNFSFAMYIGFITRLMLVFGLAFQTPSAIFFLNKVGVVSLGALRRSRKYVLLGTVVVAAMATPPDPVSQVALAVPLYLLFELGIILSWFSERRRSREVGE